jgi:regulator of RNase E activity RraB
VSFRDLFGRRRKDEGIGADSAPRHVDPVDADRRVLEELSRAGADASQSREVTHTLYAPSREMAENLAAIVRNEGHEAEVREPQPADDGPRPWAVLATSHTVVTPEGVAAARRRFTELAAEFGSEYDGWEAAV